MYKFLTHGIDVKVFVESKHESKSVAFVVSSDGKRRRGSLWFVPDALFRLISYVHTSHSLNTTEVTL